MKWKYGGEQSMGRAKISWACRELQRRMDWQCPCRNHSSRLVQAARGLLWWRPLQSQLFNSFWEDTEKFGIHPGFGGAGCWRRQEGGVSYRVRQHLCIRSCHWHAVIGQLFITTTKRNQTTRTGRGTLVRMGGDGEPEVTADDRPAPPGTICPASSIREKEEASSAARCSQRPRKAF